MARWRIGARRTQRDDDRRARRRFLAVGAIAPVLVLLPGAIGVEPARAGTYVMRNCDVPGYRSSPLFPWDVPASEPGVPGVVDSCASGGGVAFTLDAPWQFGDSGGRYIWLRKPTGPRSHIKLVKAVLWYAARLAGSGQPLRFDTGEYNSDNKYAHGLSNGPPGSENLVGEQQFAPDTAAFRVGLVCAGEPGQTCVAANPVPLLIRGMEVTLSEDIPPTVLPPSGALLEGGEQSGLRSLTYSASDPHSGVSKVDVLLGDTVVESHDLAPRCFYSDFTVCPASDDNTLAIDTRTVPNGRYDLVLRVRDAAGNEQVVHGERAVEVANAPPSEAMYTIVAKFKGSSRSNLSVSYGRRVSLRGRLTQNLQPVAADTPIELLERHDRSGARERSTRGVMTRADGSFAIGLSTSRPSRTIRLAYRPVGGGEVLSRPLKLRVRAASRVRASLRGRVIHFSGMVLSAPLPRGGKRVQMEGRSPGSAWTRFEALRTDRTGRFSGRYRLRVRRRGVVLKIRAVVPSEAGYGYLSSRSQAVTLRVR